MEKLGVKVIIFTDIDTDGTLSGPAFEKLAALQRAVGCQIVASGGVARNADIRALAEMGLYGAIIGKAYYAGTIDLAQAVKDGGDQC
jgi:phosphoribosylformimino-5-aminoimidazole carboxamide ribotide isomerase